MKYGFGARGLEKLLEFVVPSSQIHSTELRIGVLQSLSLRHCCARDVGFLALPSRSGANHSLDHLVGTGE
jgi:hypothetical protein